MHKIIYDNTKEIPTKPSLWKDANGFNISLEYCG